MTFGRKSTGGRLWALAALATLVVGLASIPAPRAHADTTAGACGRSADGKPCVVVISVDGLEPKDVNRTQTPFLWALAHPTSADPQDTATAQALTGRHGFEWEAARTVMSASTAPAVESLLTRANPSYTGIVADDQMVDEKGTPSQRRLYPPGDDAALDKNAGQGATSLFEALSGEDTAAYIGDPAVYDFLNFQTGDATHFWRPTSNGPDNGQPDEDQGNPAFCPIDRTPQPAVASPQDNVPTSGNTPACAANDLTTVHAATQGADGINTSGQMPTFTYMYLAELGQAKLKYGDVGDEGSGDPNAPQPGTDPNAQQRIGTALGHVDAALAAFVGAMSNSPTDVVKNAWPHTILVVVGTHGYERTPVADRIPDPDAATDPSMDLSDFVKLHSRDGKAATLIPQGTQATIYYPGASATELSQMRDELLGTVNNACLAAAPATKCVSNVYATHPVDGLPSDFPMVPASWRYDALDKKTGKRTGASGDLVVTIDQPWAAGRAVNATNNPSGVTDTILSPKEITNPYDGSEGGPDNRAVAAFVDGPTGLIRQIGGEAAAVTAGADTTCVGEASDPAPTSGLAEADANKAPGDDTDSTGHECQADVVDFAPTIAALLNADLGADQLAGQARF